MPKRTFNLSALDEKILKHTILDLDKWHEELIANEVDRRKNEVVMKAVDAHRQDPSVKTMSADDDTLLTEVFSANGYQNAKQREDAMNKRAKEEEDRKAEERRIVEEEAEKARHKALAEIEERREEDSQS